MNLSTMNTALDSLCDKYAVTPRGTIEPDPSGTHRLHFSDGRPAAPLLPWRVERRFTELKTLIANRTLEDVSTLRFAAIDPTKTLRQLLFRELDLCVFLGESSIVRTFAVTSGDTTANVLVKLADGKSASVECSTILPAAASRNLDRHEIIARRGIACDRVVDTQVPQSSIYLFTDQGETRFTDTDAELFGLSEEQILCVRASFSILKNPVIASEWNRAAASMQNIVEKTLSTEREGKPACFQEVC